MKKYSANERISRSRLAYREKRAVVDKFSHDNFLKFLNLFDEGFCIIEMIFDRNGKPSNWVFRSVNKVFYRHTGQVNLIGKKISEPASDTESQWFKRFERVVTSGEPLEFTAYSKSLNKWFDVKAFQIGRAADHLAAVIFDDITKQKKDEEKLRESQEKFQALIETNVDFFWETDQFGRYTYCSPQMENLWNIKPREMTGKTPFDMMPDEERKKGLEMFSKMAEAPLPFRGLESSSYNGKGEIIYTETSGVPFFDDKGQFLGFRGITRDITSHKKAEWALLEKEKKGAERDIIKLNEQLRRSNKELESFAYVASHDLQEPLRMVTSFTQMLEQRYGDKLDSDAKDYIRFAVEGAKQMYDLINGLLNYSRINSSQGEFREVDMNTIFDRAKDNLNLLIREKNARVSKTELPVVMADINQMLQLVQNLFENAIKFSDGDPNIRFESKTEPDKYVFWVADNGIGIEKEYFERIFRIFQRLRPREEYEGTGIGLAICKRIVERHNGRIWVESEPGRGSTFYFSVPR